MNTFNWVDYVVITIFVISVLGGLMRGLVKEVIALITWCAAFLVASVFATRLAGAFTGNDQVQSLIATAPTQASQPISFLAIGISFIAIFIGVIVVGSVINMILSRAAESQGISFINRSLGAVFGLVRGFLITLLMMFLVQLSPVAAQPVWTSSQFVQAFQPAVVWLADTVQPGVDGLKARLSTTLQSVGSQYRQFTN